VTSADTTVSIVIPTYRNPESLAATLESVASLDFDPRRWEVVVVDDGGGDAATAAVVERARSNMPVPITLRAQPNAGAAAARNTGARLATGDVLLFLDDDMLVRPSLVREHLETLEHFAPAFVCGYREWAPELAAILADTPFGRYRMDAEVHQEWGTFVSEHDEPFPASCRNFPAHLTANNLSAPREAFLALGGFDEEYPYASYEDQDLAVRANRAGFATITRKDLLAWHNDRRVTLRAFCARQERGATGSVLLAKRFPDVVAGRELYIENGPVMRGDPLGRRIRKLVKAVLATPPATAALFALTASAERLHAPEAMLRRLYDALVATHTFRGVRAGWSRYRPSGVAQ